MGQIMTAELHITPSRATNSNGFNLDGAKWFFYQTGTTTPQSVYTTAALSVAHSNPVEADAAGKFPPIFFDSSLSYRGVLKTADEVTTIYDIDPINAGVLASLGASSGSSAVGFLQSGTGSLARTVQSKLRDFMSLADKGTTADALTALQDAETDLSAGGRVHVPKASWTLSGTFTADGQRMNIFGDGANVSNFVFNPASTDVAIEYNNPAAGGMYQGSIEGIGFTSSNSVDKTAIRLVNCADVTIQRVGIAGGGWLGTGSIGIKTEGRQTLRIIECQINCARPIVFGQNAAFTTLNTDHYLVDYCELTTNLSTGSNIEFENNVMHTNTTLRNLALTSGKYGIYWNATSSPGASYALNIENIRTEQGADATGYSIYLADSTNTLQTLTIRNAMLDNNRNGIYLRRCQRVVMENVFFNQGAGKTALDMTFIAGSRLILINCTKQPSSTMTLTNARCIRRESITDVGFVEEWIYDAGFSSGAIESDVYHGGKPFALNVDDVVPIADNTFTGFVLVSTSEDVSAIYCLRGTNNTTLEVADPNAFFTPTVGSANQYNIYWDAGTSRYVIQSKRPVNANVSVYRIGTTA